MKQKKKTIAIKKEKKSESSFAKMQTLYGVTSPEQIQMKLLWIMIKQLMLLTAGRTPQNVKIIKHYDAHWNECQKEIAKQNIDMK